MGSFRDLSARILAGTCFLATSLPADAAVASYRYSLNERPCRNYARYVGTVSPLAPYRYEVETDSANRIVRVTRYKRGRALSETRNTAFNTANLPITTVTSENGTPTGRESTERDASGCVVRAVEYTMSGARTGSSTYTYNTEYVEVHGFSADDKPVSTARLYYNADGLLTRAVGYSNPLDVSVWYEKTLDPSTGIVTEIRQYKDYGKTLVNRQVYQYDSNDVVVHVFGFNAAGRLFATRDFNNGVLAKLTYNYSNGTTREITYTDDARGYITAAEQRDNGVLHCRFTIEYLADGTAKRTVVQAADGTMLAEYPNQAVAECRADGTVIGELKGTIYKSPPWW
jgi:antitoxin component YwqK of YwqJK toxin-antitoxin module